MASGGGGTRCRPSCRTLDLVQMLRDSLRLRGGELAQTTPGGGAPREEAPSPRRRFLPPELASEVGFVGGCG